MVRYDIPGDAPEAKPELCLRTTNKDMLLWTNISYGQSVTVRNSDRAVLTNLTPGTYFFRRCKRDGSRARKARSETVLIEAGQTAHADMVQEQWAKHSRKSSRTRRGQVIGRLHLCRSGDATGLPWPQRSRNEQNEFKYRTFDVSQFGADGTFQTAMLVPGTYTVAADVYPPSKFKLDALLIGMTIPICCRRQGYASPPTPCRP